MVKLGSTQAPWLVFVLLLSGCDVIGDIFAAGVWFGVFAVVAVIAGIIWLFTRMFS